MLVVSLVRSLHQVNMSVFWFCTEKHAEDNNIPVWRQPKPPHQENGPKQGFSAWRCLFRPSARQPTGNVRNARLLLDRRPCSTYWLLVGRATGTMSKMSSHTIGTRHLWLFGHGKKWKVHTQDSHGSRPPTDTLGEVLLRADAPHIFGPCVKSWRKGLPSTQPGCPIWGDLNGLLLPFSAIVSLLVSQSDDAFNY